MANEVSIIETRLTANVDEHDKKIAASEKKLTDFGKNASDAGFKSWTNKISSSLQSWGTQLTVGLTAPLVLLGAKIFAIGAEYEKAMNTFQAVTRASADEMKRASAVAEKLGADMSLPATSAGDAARAMTELAKGGLSAAQAMDATRGSLMLAAAAQVDEARAAEITANALNTFGLAAGEAMRVSDLLAAASNASSAEINDIALAMQQAGSSAAALKVPIEDLVTGIGLMANAGIKGSDAGTSLKTMMAALTPSTEKAAGAMKQLGIDAFDAKGNFVGFEEIIRQAQPALAKMTAEQRAYAIEAAFGSDAQRSANVLLGQGVEAWQKMSGAVNQAGAASELAAAKSKGLSGAWDGLISQLETAGLKVFQTLAPTIENVTRKIAEMSQGLSNLRPEVIQFGAAAAAVAGTAGPLAMMAGKLLALGPGGAIVAAVIVGVAAMAGAYATNFGQMRETVDSFLRDVTSTLSDGKIQIDDWGKVWRIAGIGIIETLDLVLLSLKRNLVFVKGWALEANAIMTGQWDKIGDITKATAEKIDQIDREHHERLVARSLQTFALLEGNWESYYATVSVTSEKGAQQINQAFIGSYLKDWQATQSRILQAGNQLGSQLPGSFVTGFNSNKDAIGSAVNSAFSFGNLHTKVRNEFGLLGNNAVSGWNSTTKKSPFFIIHDMEDSVKHLHDVIPPKMSKAGKAIAAALKKAFEDELKDINTFLERAFGGTGSISERILKELKKKFPDVAREVNEQAESFRHLNENLELYAVLMSTAAGRNTEVAKKIKEAIDTLLAKAKAMESVVTPSFVHFGVEVKKATIYSEEHRKATLEHIQSLFALGSAANKTGNDFKFGLAEKMADALKDIKDKTKSALGDGVGGILVSLGEKFKINQQDIARWAGNVGSVIATMPGKWGDATRSIFSTLSSWTDFANSILKILHDLNNKIPSSIGDMVSSIAGIFKKGKDTVKTGVEDWAGELEKLSTGAGEGAGGASGKSFSDSFMSKIPAIATGLATFFGTRGQGRLTGVLGGAMAGFQIGSAFGPWGAGIGAGIGAIAGLFGSGKSKEQKEAEEKAKQAAAMDMQRFVADLNSAILDGLNKGFELLEKLHGFSEVPRKAIKRFLNEIFLILSMFVEESAKFKAEGLAAAKAVTENLGDTFSFLLSGADLVEKIRGIEAVTQEDVNKLFASIDKILDGWFSLVEHIEKGVAKRAGKIGGLLQTSLQTIQLIPATIKAMTETPDITDEQINRPFEFGKRILDKFFELADQFKTLALNRLVKTAEAFSKIFESGKSMFEFFKLWSEYKPVDATIFDSINADFDRVKSWFLDAITRVDEWLGLEETLEDKIAALGERMSGIGAALTGAFGGAGGQNLTLQPTIASSAISALPPGGFSAAASGGGETHIHFHGPVLTRSQFQDEVRRALNEANRRGA